MGNPEGGVDSHRNAATREKPCHRIVISKLSFIQKYNDSNAAMLSRDQGLGNGLRGEGIGLDENAFLRSGEDVYDGLSAAAMGTEINGEVRLLLTCCLYRKKSNCLECE